MGMGERVNPHNLRVTPFEISDSTWHTESSKNLVDSAIELYNELNESYYDLNSIRRIFSKISISDSLRKDNPSNSDIGNIHGPVLRKKKN